MPDLVYSLPDLPYDYGALEPRVSGRIMELHHDKHHATYVKGANTALERLHDLRGKGDFTALSMLEKSLAFNVSGHVLHSVFWTNLSPNGGGEPEGELATAIEDGFDGLPLFRQQMTEAAGTIQGRIVVQQVYDHQGNHGQGTVPLLAIDAWEHAYYLQYLNEKAKFFDALWNVVNWRDVARRFTQARSSGLPTG